MSKKDVFFNYSVVDTKEGDFMVNTKIEAREIVREFGNEHTYIKKGKFTIKGGKWVNVDLGYKLRQIKANFDLTVKCRIRNIFSAIFKGGYNLHFNDFKRVYSYNNYVNRVYEQFQVKGIEINQSNWYYMEQEVNRMQMEGKLTDLYDFADKE